jgi:hypothetical protein
MPRGGINYSQPINRSHLLARGLVGFWAPLPWYKSGPRLIDISGGRNHGTLTNAPTWVPGLNGIAGVRFTAGSDQYVAMPANWAGYSTYSICAAFRPRSLGTNQQVVGADNSASLLRVFQFRTNVSSQLEAIGFDTSDTPTTVSGGTTLANNVIYTGAFTIAAGAGNLNLYLNGKSDASAGTVSSVNVDASPWAIGARRNPGGTDPGDPCSHDIFAVALYDRVLPQSEVTAWDDQWRRGFPTLINRLSSRQMKGAAATGNRRRRVLCGAA